MAGRTRGRDARAVILLWAALAAGCGWRPADEQILVRFFDLARLHDTTRLASVASVSFNPTVEGVVDRFAVVERSDSRTPEGGHRRVVRLRAHLRSPAGRPQERLLDVTLERASAGQWMVSGLRRVE